MTTRAALARELARWPWTTTRATTGAVSSDARRVARTRARGAFAVARASDEGGGGGGGWGRGLRRATGREEANEDEEGAKATCVCLTRRKSAERTSSRLCFMC